MSKIEHTPTRSEQVYIRMTTELKQAIAKLARRDSRTLSNWIVLQLQRAVDNDKTRQ